MSGQAWPTQTESWPSGTGLTRCVCLDTCVCACVDWKPARKQVEQRPQPASWAAARGPGQQPRLEARLQGGRHTAVQPSQVGAEEMAGGRPGVASPPLPKDSLASTLRAPDHSRAEPGSTYPTSPRGPGPGQAAGPLRGPRCPGRWAFGRQTLHRSPTAAAQPSPPSRPRRGHLSEDTAPGSPTPRLSDSQHSRPSWSHFSAPPHTSSTPKVLPQGRLRAGRSCQLTELPCRPRPVLVTLSLGFPACELDNTTQPQRAPVPEDREEEGPCGQVLSRSSPPSCPAAPQDGPRPWAGSAETGPGSWTNSTRLRTQSRSLQLRPRLGQRSPA